MQQHIQGSKNYIHIDEIYTVYMVIYKCHVTKTLQSSHTSDIYGDNRFSSIFFRVLLTKAMNKRFLLRV